MSIEITDEWKRALGVLSQSNSSVFITGKAGTGKSTLLKQYLISLGIHPELPLKVPEIAVVAPTGIAALNIGRVASTIHRLFRFRPNVTLDDVVKLTDMDMIVRCKQLRTLIIDEISMVRADLFDAIEKFLRINGTNHGVPFGGVRLVMIGDLYQLPPVIRTECIGIFHPESGYYPGPFFFQAHSFLQLHLTTIELTRVFRQTDPEFLALLQAVRTNTATDADLDSINRRVYPHFVPEKETLYVTLTSTRGRATHINHEMLSELGQKTQRREFVFTGVVDGDFPEMYLPTERDLRLVEGAQVMMLNNDPLGRWVNGTLGHIDYIIEDPKNPGIAVRMEDGSSYDVEPYTWELYDLRYNRRARKLESITIGSFTQFPVMLAWAITIHKSQGRTFSRVILDLGRRYAFAGGQTYVALSRCRTLEGLVLKRPIALEDIKVSESAVMFFQIEQAKTDFPVAERVALLSHAFRTLSVVHARYLRWTGEQVELVFTLQAEPEARQASNGRYSWFVTPREKIQGRRPPLEVVRMLSVELV